MSVSSADTAELPLVRIEDRILPAPSERAATTPLDLHVPVLPQPLPSPIEERVARPGPAHSGGRAAVVAERRRLRRRQWAVASGGLAVVGAVFGATVAVLDVLH
jgi:hypothetical protein